MASTRMTTAMPAADVGAATVAAAPADVVARAAAAGAFADHHAAEHDRLGAFARVRLEAGDRLPSGSRA